MCVIIKNGSGTCIKCFTTFKIESRWKNSDYVREKI